MPGMAAALRHRGPDGDGFFDDGVAALAHRRLAIIDVAGGDQPISNEDGQFWIVFNGEIYNHRALRHVLVQRGHQFSTQSDTETIVHAYEEFGVECVSRLDGMFAFAIYDRGRRELFIARDRLGKKPCFYGVFAGALHFASEMKALRVSPAFDGTLDSSWLETYLPLGYLVAPRTVYRHVSKLEPGHWLRASSTGVQVQKYWDVTEFDTDTRPEPAILSDLDGLLHAAVHERLESEVPLGAFLSGGIDSGLVVSYMSQEPGTTPTTVSVGFDDAEHNELKAAELTAQALHTRHYAHLLAPRLIDVLDSIVGAYDEPFADSSSIPTYYVSQAARQHVTVALSGDGGDEPFAGYDFRYVPHALESFGRELLPKTLRPPVRQLAGLWPRGRRLPRALRLATLLDNVTRDAADAYYADLCFVKPSDVQRLLGQAPTPHSRDGAAYDAATQPYLRCPSPDAVQRAEYADLKVYMPNAPLVKVDRMSMLNSLEVRCPLLDHKVVEFAFRVPVARKMPRLHAKHLLRALAARRLPPSIAGLAKRGFSAPAGQWIVKDCAEQFREDVLNERGPLARHIDVTFARQLFEQHTTGQVDRSSALWTLWMAARWLALQEPCGML